MFFNRSALLSFAFVFTTGCSWWGGDVSERKLIKVDEGEVLGQSANCVDEIGAFFSSYFLGVATKADINRNFICVFKTVDVIFENAEEKDIKNGFSRDEMIKILTTIFPRKNAVVLKDNVEILFLLKRLFVGGSVDGFNRLDHLRLRKTLPSIQSEFIKSRESIKTLFFGSSLSYQDREKSFKQLRKSFYTLDVIREKNGGVFTEPEGVSLIEYIFKNKSLSKFKGLAYVAKTFVYNNDPKVFLVSQKDFFERLIRLLEVQAKFRAVDFKQGILFGTTYYDLEDGILLSSSSLLKWAKADKNWQIALESFSSALSAVRNAGIWTDRFSDPDLVSNSIQKVLAKIFEKDKLDQSSMEKLESFFRGWVERQESIISKYDFSWIKNKKIVKKSAESQYIIEEVNAFKTPQFVSVSNAPIVIKRDGGSIVPAELYFDQSLKHLLTSVANEIFKAYSSAQPFVKGTVKKRISLRLPEVTKIFQDVRPLGLEFGFNDPHHCGSEKRVFIEADSLTLSGNGDSEVSIRESVEWLASMLSIATVSDQVFTSVESSCALPGLKVLGSSFLGRSCALEQLAASDRVLKNHFPGTFTYVDMLKSESRRKEFEKKLGGIADWFDGIDYKKKVILIF